MAPTASGERRCERGRPARRRQRARSSAEVPVGATPTHIAVGEGAIWVTNADGNSVSRIDPAEADRRPDDPRRQQPERDRDRRRRRLGDQQPGRHGLADRPGDEQRVVQHDSMSETAPSGIAYAAGSIWVANTGDDTITRIDADSGKPSEDAADRRDRARLRRRNAVGERERLRTASCASTRATGSVVASIPVGNGPDRDRVRRRRRLGGEQPGRNGLAHRPGDELGRGGRPDRKRPDGRGGRRARRLGEQPVRRHARCGSIRARTRLARRISVGNRPQGVAISGGNVLVSVRQSGAGHRGGTLTVRMNRAPDSIDTAVAYDTTSWPFLRMTNDGLVAYNQASGLAGDPARARPRRLAPDPDRRRQDVHLPAAAEHPLLERQAGQGVRFPLHVRARLQDRRALRRRTTTASSARLAASRRPKRCDLSRGIVADDAARTVTFHLVAPDPEFLVQARARLRLRRARGNTACEAGTQRRRRCRQPGRT